MVCSFKIFKITKIMTFKEIHGERTFSFAKLKQIFTQKRLEDDDFKREYLSHEIDNWIKDHFIQVSDKSHRLLVFPQLANKYNSLRGEILRAATNLFNELGLDVDPLKNMNCDELLQEISMYEND